MKSTASEPGLRQFGFHNSGLLVDPQQPKHKVLFHCLMLVHTKAHPILFSKLKVSYFLKVMNILK